MDRFGEPDYVIDGDGDRWERQADGRYRSPLYDGPGDMTLRGVWAEYGNLTAPDGSTIDFTVPPVAPVTWRESVEALHPKYPDSDHCAEDGHPYPCPTLVEIRSVDTVAAPAISREDALTKAREHVEQLATNSRGYQDGVTLRDKAASAEAFARFLLGETRE